MKRIADWGISIGLVAVILGLALDSQGLMAFGALTTTGLLAAFLIHAVKQTSRRGWYQNRR